MEDLTLIRFIVSDRYYGYPEPFIPDGYIVLLIQDGKLQISKYNEPSDANPVPEFEHPKDPSINKEIEVQLVEIIKREYPHYLSSDESTVLTCPRSIAKEIIW